MTKKTNHDPKLKESIQKLQKALKHENKIHDDPVYLAGIIKCFEVSIEYSWKLMKRETTKQGYEVYSPREAIKLAGKTKIIDDVELWLNFLEDRNLSVHDYLGIPEKEYLELIKRYLIEAKKLILK